MDNKNWDTLVGLLVILGLIVTFFSLYIAFKLTFRPSLTEASFPLLVAGITIVGLLNFIKKNK